MKNNPVVVLAAVQEKGDALYYASNEMKNNRDVGYVLFDKMVVH